MARPSEDFRLAWSSLSGGGPEAGWQFIPLAAAGAFRLRAGRRSPDNAEAILVGFENARLAVADTLPQGQGFAVDRADPDGGSSLWLALTRRPAGGPELFTTMVCDVVGTLDDAVACGTGTHLLLGVFLGRVRSWQEFMRKGTQALSPEAEIGLVGELTILRALMAAGIPPARALESWLGPLDGVQDFALGTGALEVKTTLATVGFPARIGSLEQLDNSLRQPLFVAGVRLRQTGTGLNLVALIEAVRLGVVADGEAQRLLTERLLAAGYVDAHADRYTRKFEPTEVRLLEVTEEFPRLTIGTVPVGITAAAYGIDLARAGGESVSVETALQKLGAI